MSEVKKFHKSNISNYRTSWALHQNLEVLIEDNKIPTYNDYGFNAFLMGVKLFPLALSSYHHFHSNHPLGPLL